MENGKKREFQGRSMQKCGKFQGAMVISTRNLEGFKNDILNEGGDTISSMPLHYTIHYTSYQNFKTDHQSNKAIGPI